MPRPTLLTAALRRQLLQNGHKSRSQPDFDPVPVAKLFTPDASATWLLTELNPDNPDLAFGLGVVCGKGRNPTLRLWPAIFSGEIDVFPSERRNMGQEIGR